jgi:hypothetical protein
MSRARIARTAGALCLALAFTVFASPAFACSRGYSYAGLYASRPTGGIAASLTMLDMPVVNGGHVAAWVGIGGPGLGPNGSDEWLQVGIASFDSSGGRLYYEVAVPGQEPRFVELAAAIEPGQTVRVALLELPFAPGTWVIVTPAGLAGPFFLPRSDGAWAPVATAESWAAGGSRCNRSSYRFGRVELAGGGGRWHTLRHGSRLQDPGWRLHRYSPATFSASAV